MDTHHCNVIVSGSSARYLSVDIATELRGRSISYRFHPLSFREFARFQQHEISFQEAYSESEKNRLSSLFQCYLERGSYPALAHIEDKETRKIILSTYFDLSYSRDIMDRYEVSKSMMLKKLMRRLVKISGFPFTVRKLVRFLESEGFKTSEATVSSYIDLITNTCFFLPVPIYGNEKKQKANAQKLYTIDHTMAVLFREFDPATGIKLEHAVLSDLYRQSQEIFYYRTITNREIDFVVTDEGKHPLLLVQVTDDLEESLSRGRESTREGMKELAMKEAYMVTQTVEADEEVEEGIIHTMPAWRFSLALPTILKKAKGSQTGRLV
jgi:predicted AAA+ superfamily ATPase